MVTLGEWIHNAEAETRNHFRHWPEARELAHQMKSELKKRSKHVFFVLRNDSDPTKPMHQCIMLSRERMRVWEDHLLSIAKLGWFIDPLCVICFREKRRKALPLGSSSKKSRVISLDDIL